MDRRTMLGLSLPMVMALGMDASRSAVAKAAHQESKAPTEDPPKPIFFSNDPEMSFGALVLLGSTDYGGAETGEVLATTRKIREHDGSSWCAAWTWIADKVSAEAERQFAKGHYVSARDGYLRASNYYRVSDFYLHGTPDDPRVERCYKRTVECYTAAGALFKPAMLPVEIPYEGTTLPGYMSFPKPYRKGRTTIVMCTGFDGAAQDMHFLGGAAAMERDYNVLMFDGPGQFGPIHRQGLPFRYDWEHVVTPIVDFVLKQPGVEPERLAMLGVSLGGYLAPRAAVFEKRIKALICNGGVYDYSRLFLNFAPAGQQEAFVAALKAEQAPSVDKLLETAMAKSSQINWFMTHGMYSFGVKTPREFIRKTLDFNLKNGLAEKITCPTLVCNPTADSFMAGEESESVRLFNHLSCQKTLLNFTGEEGAGGHCEVGAARLAYGRIYDWLDELFA